MDNKFKKDLTLKEFAEDFYYYKKEYDKIKNNHEKVLLWRHYFLSLDTHITHKEKMWEVLNDDMTLDEFNNYVGGVYRGCKWGEEREKGFAKNTQNKYYLSEWGVIWK